MEIWQAIILLLVGIIAGFLNVVAGGGSMLTVPVMVFMGMPGPVANGTNRIAILAQNITAIITFFRKGYSDFVLSFTLLACALPGAIAGALVGVHLHGIWFNRILALIMLVVMLLMILKKDTVNTEHTGRPDKKRNIIGHILMIGAGFFGGFIQVGVGFILMPILHRVMGMDLVRVNMHKVFIIAGYTIVALGIFAWKVEVLWLVGLSLAIGNSIGGWLGAHFTIRKGEHYIRIVLNVVLTVFIIKLLFFTQ